MTDTKNRKLLGELCDADDLDHLDEMKADKLGAISDILSAQFITVAKKQRRASLRDNPLSTVSELQHIVNSRKGNSKEVGVQLGEGGDEIYIAKEQGITPEGKLKLTIREVRPEDYTAQLLDIATAITKVETARHKIKGGAEEGLRAKAAEYMAQINQSFRVITQEQLQDIKHADEMSPHELYAQMGRPLPKMFQNREEETSPESTQP
jgi:hypothetical protein